MLLSVIKLYFGHLSFVILFPKERQLHGLSFGWLHERGKGDRELSQKLEQPKDGHSHRGAQFITTLFAIFC